MWRFKCPTTIEQREQITERDPTARLRIAVWKQSSIAIREREKLKEKTGEKTGGPLKCVSSNKVWGCECLDRMGQIYHPESQL